MRNFVLNARRLPIVLLAAATIFFASLSPTRAQVTTGTLSGTVHDSSGAVVPGAEVVINHTDTGNTRTVKADAQGRYQVPNLAIGNYTVQASSQGFKTELRSGLQLNVGQIAVINFALTPGAVTESITIREEAPIVDTATSAIGTLVNREQIRDLPLNGRDYTQLVLLQPGVIRYREQSAELNRGSGVRMSIAGSRANQVTYRLNGLDISDGAGTTPGSATGHSLGVDAIQEFQVLTNSFSAEYGKSAGGVINVVHKAGTNTLHGALFEYLRNDNLDANDFMSNRAGVRKPEFKRNQFGASAGGPVLRDKTFFFGSYEGLRDRTGVTKISLVPSNDARRGILRGVNVGVAPSTRPFLDVIPTANGTDFGDGTAERAESFSTRANENYVVGKLDHTFSERDNLSGSYTFDQGVTNGPAPRGGIGMFIDSGRTRAQYVTLKQVHSFSPTLLNSFNVGFNRSFGTGTHDPIQDYPANLQFIAGQPWQSMEVTGIDRIEFNFENGRQDRALIFNTWQYSDNLTFIRGSHSMKAGFEGYRFFFRYVTEGRSGGGGRYQYSNMTQFLTGTPERYEAQRVEALGLTPSIFQNMYGFFFQDDIRLRPTLTINAGVRYEFLNTPKDVLPIQGHLANLTDPTLTVGRDVWGSNPTLKSFAPRLGMAWDVFGNQKTALRGGAGFYFDPMTSYYFLPVIQGNPPFRLLSSVDRPNFPNGYPQIIATPPSTAVFDLTSGDYTPDQPYRIQYNLGLQHEVVQNLSLGLFYVGAQSIHTSQMYLNANTRVPRYRDNGSIFFVASDPQVNPRFGVNQYRQFGGHSSYNSFQVMVNKRMSQGMQVQGSYTWSKSLDNGDIFSFSSEGLNTVSLQNIYQPGLERGVSAFDARHNFTLNATYDVPSLQGMHALARGVLSGWQLGGIMSLATGHPFTPILGFDNANIRTRARGDHLRPDIRPGAKANTTRGQDAAQYFDPTVFAIPEAGTLGNVARGTITGPGLANVDFTLKKKYSFGERRFLEFRSEFFNVFNRANFRLPEEDQRTVAQRPSTANPTGVVATAGRLTALATTPRQIQFSLRYEF